MQTYNVTTARANLYNLLTEVNQSHSPIQILGKTGDAVLISADDWRSIEETMYLNSIHGMVESIVSAANEPIENSISADEVDW